jgi:hypothetical protein
MNDIPAELKPNERTLTETPTPNLFNWWMEEQEEEGREREEDV